MADLPEEGAFFRLTWDGLEDTVLLESAGEAGGGHEPSWKLLASRPLRNGDPPTNDELLDLIEGTAAPDGAGSAD